PTRCLPPPARRYRAAGPRAGWRARGPPPPPRETRSARTTRGRPAPANAVPPPSPAGHHERRCAPPESSLSPAGSTVATASLHPWIPPRLAKAARYTDAGFVMRIATWNVNSLGARLTKVTWWLERAQPDVLLMQETKLNDSDVPRDELKRLGYELAHHGAGGWNGVAIASPHPINHVIPKFGLSLRGAA